MMHVSRPNRLIESMQDIALLNLPSRKILAPKLPSHKGKATGLSAMQYIESKADDPKLPFKGAVPANGL